MSELNEPRWSVLSERGCEAAHLDYPAAAQLVARLTRESVFGLCIITDEAAARLNHKPDPTEASAKSVRRAGRKRRTVDSERWAARRSPRERAADSSPGRQPWDQEE